MKWEETRNADGYCHLSVEADWSELASDYEDIVAGYSKVRLAGFRPGKVRREVMQRRFSRQIIDELSRRVGRRLGREAVREAGIESWGPIEVETTECKKDRPFRFQVRFQPAPLFELPDLSGLKTKDDGTDFRDRISRRLIEVVAVAVPDVLVTEELVSTSLQGTRPDGPEWNAARDRVKLMLILKRIARQEGIEVDERDVNNRIAEKAKEFGTSQEALQEELRKGGGMQRLRDMLLAESTLDYLRERIGSP